MPLPGANCVFHSPVGYIYDPDGRTIMDPNEEIQHAVATLFKAFRTTGSAYGVVRYFAENSLFFPKRAYGGAWDGKITWGTLTPQPRPLQSSTTLPMPGHTFMGVTAITKPLIPHGAFRTPSLSVSQIRMTGKSFSPTIIRLISPGKSSRKTRIALAPTVQTRNGGGPAREGAALLTGILICGKCGRRMTGPLYRDWRQYVHYTNVSAAGSMGIKQPVLPSLLNPLTMQSPKKILSIMKPSELEISLKVMRSIHDTNRLSEKQWLLSIERAQYEADRAERQFMLADPENRLVVRSLESNWNQKLKELEKAKQDYAI